MKSLNKARDILCLVADQPGITLAEAARSLALPKSTTFRFLRALERTGFLLSAEENSGYRLGPLIRQLSSGRRNREALIALAHPHMVALRDSCNETVALHVLESQQWIVIHQVESTQELRRTITNMGVPMALHAAATGKLFLALMPDPERDAYLDAHELVAYTPNTITSRRRLLDELRLIRNRGYSLSYQEVALGVAGISVPLRFGDDGMDAALGVSGPIGRFTPKAVAQIRNSMKQTVTRIEDDHVTKSMARQRSASVAQRPSSPAKLRAHAQ